MGHEVGGGFLVGVTAALATLKLTWKTDDPVWVDQWPLEQEKLSSLKNLIQEQLQKRHIKSTNSPWNSPVFVIRKKASGIWRLLHDFRKINEVLEDMGPLQLGLPSVSMIPRDWTRVVIDLKDCFFSIPLHPDDAPRLAFSVPSINKETPLQRYHWVVLVVVQTTSQPDHRFRICCGCGQTVGRFTFERDQQQSFIFILVRHENIARKQRT